MNLKDLDQIASSIKETQLKEDYAGRNKYLIEQILSSKNEKEKIGIEEGLIGGLNAAIEIAVSQSITVTLKTLIELGIIHVDN